MLSLESTNNRNNIIEKNKRTADKMVRTFSTGVLVNIVSTLFSVFHVSNRCFNVCFFLFFFY